MSERKSFANCINIQKTEINDESSHEPDLSQFFGRVMNYIHQKNIQLLRGDIVALECGVGYKNNGKMIYDGRKLQNLEQDLDDYGHIPKGFRVINEFPIQYWAQSIDHNEIVWFDVRPFLSQLKENVEKCNDDYVITHFRSSSMNQLANRGNTLNTLNSSGSNDEKKNNQENNNDRYEIIFPTMETFNKLIRQCEQSQTPGSMDIDVVLPFTHELNESVWDNALEGDDKNNLQNFVALMNRIPKQNGKILYYYDQL